MLPSVRSPFCTNQLDWRRKPGQRYGIEDHQSTRAFRTLRLEYTRSPGRPYVWQRRRFGSLRLFFASVPVGRLWSVDHSAGCLRVRSWFQFLDEHCTDARRMHLCVIGYRQRKDLRIRRTNTGHCAGFQHRSTIMPPIPGARVVRCRRPLLLQLMVPIGIPSFISSAD